LKVHTSNVCAITGWPLSIQIIGETHFAGHFDIQNRCQPKTQPYTAAQARTSTSSTSSVTHSSLSSPPPSSLNSVNSPANSTMPQITPLALTNPRPTAPGWAYVLESIVPDPSKQPLINATSSTAHGKKRKDGGNYRAAAKSATEALMSGHAKARAARLRQRFEDLNVELGHRGHARGGGGGGAASALESTGGYTGSSSGTGGIEIPAHTRKEIQEAKWKITKGAGKAVGIGAQGQGKTTQNVRRVLTSTKNWSHHAADEEAARLHAQNAANARRDLKDKDIIMIDAPSEPQTQHQDMDDDEDVSAMLRTNVPQLPSSEALAKLTKASPLSYSAARAQIPPLKMGYPAKPNRKFCAMCGYWGTVRCTFCGTHVCGLACKTVHDAAEHPHTTR
jgi:HIT zinc finger